MAGYKEIAGWLQQNYLSGEYPEGKYPSLRKIAADMGCSYVTAVRAMRFLQNKETAKPKRSFPLVAMISSLWRFTSWCRTIRESVIELGGQLRFVPYSSFTDPVITETLNEKFDLVILDCPVELGSPLFNVIRKKKDHVIVLFQDLTQYGIRCMAGIPEETVILIMKDLACHGIRNIDMVDRAGSEASPVQKEMWDNGLRDIGGKGVFHGYPHTGFNEESAECYHYMRKSMDAGKLPEAFFCINTACAQGVYRYLFDQGIVPGKDISVFSFGDLSNAEMMTPPLATAINLGQKEMVKAVVSEYMRRRVSSRMIFRLTRKGYYIGNSLVPFAGEKTKSLTTEQNIRYSEEVT